MALFASVLGGVAGYGTGALMPLVLVPMVGAEPVVPIIAISALFNNTWRALAFKHLIDWRRALLVAAFAAPPCALSAYGYTFLTGKGAALVIGGMLMLTVPLRYLFKRHVMALDSKGLAIGAVVYGAAVGGTVGAGVILLSILMAAGLQGAAIVATDAITSIVVTGVRMAVFGFSGVIDARVMAFALLIGHGRIAGRLRGQGSRLAHVARRAHRDPRRGGAARRRSDDLRRVDAVTRIHPDPVPSFRH